MKSSTDDEFELERNSDRNEAPEPSCEMFDFSQLVERRATNAGDGIGPIKDAAGARDGANGFGKLVGVAVAHNKVHTLTIALKPSSVSNTSEKWRNQERKRTRTHQLITIVDVIHQKPSTNKIEIWMIF